MDAEQFVKDIIYAAAVEKGAELVLSEEKRRDLLNKFGSTVKAVKAARLLVLQNTIKEGLTPDLFEKLVEDERFAQVLDRTIHKCLEASSSEKVVWYARLLVAATNENFRLDFNYFARLLEELEPVEIAVLHTLKVFGEKYPQPATDFGNLEYTKTDEILFGQIETHWGEFESELAHNHGITQAEVQPLLSRLEGKGLISRPKQGMHTLAHLATPTEFYHNMERYCRFTLREIQDARPR